MRRLWTIGSRMRNSLHVGLLACLQQCIETAINAGGLEYTLGILTKLSVHVCMLQEQGFFPCGYCTDPEGNLLP